MLTRQNKRQVRKTKKPMVQRRFFQPNRPLRLNNERIVAPIPDEMTVVLRQVLPAENLFATNTTVDGVAFYMNSIFEVKSGTSFQPAYLGGYAIFYRKYRVIKSHVIFTFASREATAQCCVSVSPASGASVAATAAAFSELTSLPFAKYLNIGPIGSGANVKRLSIAFKPEKLIGPHYNQQDEYAGTPGGNPSTLLYWQVSGYNPNSFTLTTGGVQVTAEYKQTILYYEPDRDNSVSFKKYSNDVESIDNAISELSLQRKKMTQFNRSTSM